MQSDRIVPEDFTIGLLQDRQEDNHDVRETMSAIEDFLDSLIRGKVNSTPLLPEKRDYLSRTLEYFMQRGDIPEEYRVGVITIEQNKTAVTTLRLFSTSGAAIGELYLSKTGNRWYISDIQIGFHWVQRNQDETVFFPYTHRDMYTRR